MTLTSPVSTYGSVIDSARKLALAEHASHKHGLLSYSYHLVAVAGVVSCYSNDPDVIAAAWLHDIVEDCEDIDIEVVEKMTNERVAAMVDRLTDPEGPRALVKPLSLIRIANCPDHSPLIKFADRLHNIRSTLMDRSARYAGMYLREFEQFDRAFDRTKWSNHPLLEQIRSMRPELERLAG